MSRRKVTELLTSRGAGWLNRVAPSAMATREFSVLASTGIRNNMPTYNNFSAVSQPSFLSMVRFPIGGQTTVVHRGITGSSPGARTLSTKDNENAKRIGELASKLSVEVPDKFIEFLANLPQNGPGRGLIAISFGGQITAPLSLKQLVSDGFIGIKIELRKSPDPKRTNGSKTQFEILNKGTIGIFMDEDMEGREFIYELCKFANVIIDNRSPCAKDRCGVLNLLETRQYDNTPLYVDIRGYPSRSAFGHRKSYDVEVQGESGLAWANDGISITPYIDWETGNRVYGAVYAQLFARSRGERPIPTIGLDRIEVTMFETAMELIANPFGRYKDEKTKESQIVPFSVFQTQEGDITISTAQDFQFRALCDILNIPELATKFPLSSERAKNKEEIIASVQDAIWLWTNEIKNAGTLAALKTKVEYQGLSNTEILMKVLEKNQVVVGRVNNYEEVLEKYREEIIRVDTEGQEYIRGSFTDNHTMPPAPKPGEHHEVMQQVLKELLPLRVNPNGNNPLSDLLRGMADVRSYRKEGFVSRLEVSAGEVVIEK